MKIRLDFVTNSSSSCFIIAYKELPTLDDETVKKYPYLKLILNDFLARVITGGEYKWREEDPVVFESVDDLNDWIEEKYVYSRYTLAEYLKENPYLKEYYDNIKSYIDKGYTVIEKDIKYSEENTEEIIYALARALGDDFVIVESDRD